MASCCRRIPDFTPASSARKRDDSCVRVTSGANGRGRQRSISTISGPAIRQPGSTTSRGVAAELAAVGVDVSGVDLSIHGDIPIGAGLSSSASLELAVARAMLAVSGYDLDTTTLARVCRQAEIRFAGGRLRHHGPVLGCCGTPGNGHVARLPDAGYRFRGNPR